MRKKAVIIMLLTAIIINSLTGSVVMASGIDDNATGGGSSSGLSSGNGTLNWNQNKSGYRFSIIDKEGNVMSLGENGKAGSVDVFFMNYKDISTPYYFTNCKTQPLSAENSGKYINKRVTMDQLNKVAKFNSLPPYPISTNGSGTAKGEGEALKKWLMAGEKWIGRRTLSSTGNSSSKGDLSNIGGSNSTGNSNNAGNSKSSTSKYDIGKVKADIISSGKKLKIELDKNLKIDVATKTKTYYSWLYEWKNHCIGLYDEKKITREQYNDIILGTGIHTLNYLLDSNFIRMLMISLPNDFLFSGVESAIDKNLETYIKNLNKHSTYTTGDKRKALNYYVEGEKEHFKWLNDNGALSKNAYSYARRYIDKLVKDKYSIYSSSGNANDGKLVVMKMSTTSSVKADNKGGMVQTLSYTRTEPVYLSSAPTVAKNTDEVVVVNLSTASTTSSSTEEVEDKGEILKLLKTEFKGKPLFELPEHSFTEYTGMNTVDIMVAKGYSLLVENLTYIQPATWDSAKGGAGIYFNYYIFGTITNYAECLNLLKSKGYWSDMNGGAYSTPTAKLGWSALMTESDWKGEGITIKAPTKTEGTRRPMDELASVSDLSKGVIEGYGMQLYMTNPDEIEEIPEEKITPTPTPVINTGDSGIILHENEITNQFNLLDAYEGNKNKLKIQSSITGVTDRNHTVYLHDNHGTDEDGKEIPCNGHLCKISMQDNKYNHIYGISKLIDSNNVIAITKSFTSKLLDNSTGISTVGLSGNDNINTYPNYSFNLFRSMDIPTLADNNKNSSEVIKELKELGLTVSDGGADYHSSRIDSGSNQYSFNLQIGEDSNSDTSTTYSHSLESITGSQTHTLGKAEHDVDVTIKTYVGDVNIGKESSNILADEFKIGDYTIINPTRYIINPDEAIVYYPYIKMKYTLGSEEKNAYVLSKDMSIIRNSDFIELGYVKTNGNYKNLLLDSNQWSNHKRSTEFIKENDLGDRYSVLPGGATYTLKQVPGAKTYVGVKTYQTIIPDNEINYVASGAEYYSGDKAKERREELLNDINNNISRYKLTQYVTEGIEKEQKNVITKGIALDEIASGKNQTVFGNKLSKDAKYYLKSTVPEDRPNSNAIFIGNERNKQLVRTVKYTISSDTEGNVYLYKSVDNGVNILMGFINKLQTADELINLSEETQELDSKTKLITNYLKAIDRNLGQDAYGDTWYNEAFDGISVILSEYLIEVGLKDSKGNGAGIRSAVLDPKLCGVIESKRDIFNFSKETAKDKIRSTTFAINPNQISTLKGLVAVCKWGNEEVPIQLRNIEYLFLAKSFYIPNGTVMDISN